MSNTASQKAITRVETAAGRPPSFVHIGGQRCGSTWVHRCLAEHPEVLIPARKELHYFTRNYDKGDAWYLAHFTPGPQHKAWGEATPMYISYEPAAELLAKIAPDCRLICCLRNPIDRAYSIYQLKRNSDMAGATFAQVLDRDVDDIWSRGLYARHLKRWLQWFSREQILIQIYDDLIEDDARIVRELYQHIGVDPQYRPSWLGKTMNAVILPRAQDRLRSLHLGWTIRLVRASPLGQAVRRWSRRGKARVAGAYSGMSNDAKARLAEFYKEPNEELSELVGRDLTHWTPAEFR